MGKKSKKKSGTSSARQQHQHQHQQNTNSSSNDGAASSSSSSTPVAAAANAANSSPTTMMEEEMEPIAEFDLDDWEARYPFADKTSDPLAQELDKAHRRFLEGIQYANNNDFYLATEYIASAYVRDERVVRLHAPGGEGDRSLDFEILQSMAYDTVGVSMSGSVGILFLILTLSPQCGNTDQVSSLTAMKFINGMLDLVSEDMLVTSSLGLMGGLTRAKAYYWRGRLYQDMLNGRAAMKDWTTALELDPSLAVARLARLRLWKVTETKTRAEIHAECLIFLDLVHEDYSELDVIYALLALAMYEDARLGTYSETMEYYKKSLQATSRRVELYGPREEPDDVIRYVRHNLRLSYEDPERPGALKRKLLDDILPSSGPVRDVFGDFMKQQQNEDKTSRNYCLNCKKQHGLDGIQLRKCSRCRKVYYCSEACIRENWKKHKMFCNEMSGHKNTQTNQTVSYRPFQFHK